VVLQVPDQPGRGAHDGGDGHHRRPPEHPRRPAHQPDGRRYGHEHDLGGRPPAHAEEEAEDPGLRQRVALPKAQHHQEQREGHHHGGAVEAVGARGTQQEEAGPQPEDQGSERGGRLAHGAPPDPPHQPGGQPVEGQGRELERQGAGSEQGEQAGGEDRLLSTAVGLAPEEDTELAVEDVSGHEAQHRFVLVDLPEVGGEHPEADGEAGHQGASDEGRPERPCPGDASGPRRSLRPAGPGAGGGGFGLGGAQGLSREDQQALVAENQSVVTDLSKLGKPGDEFVHDFFLPATQLTFPAAQAETIAGPPCGRRRTRPGPGAPWSAWPGRPSGARRPTCT
jgi:hypothetical protein